MADEKNPLDPKYTPAERAALTQDNAAKALKGLRAQNDAAAGGVAAVDKAEAGTLSGINQRSGQMASAARSRGGGGSLAGARQSALSRELATGEARGDFAKQRVGAQQAAAQAETDLATETEKLNVAGRKLTEAGQALYQQALDDFQKYVSDSDITFMTDADREAAIAMLEQKYGSDPHPEAKKSLQMAIDRIRGGEEDAKGAWDTAAKGTVDWYNPTTWF